MHCHSRTVIVSRLGFTTLFALVAIPLPASPALSKAASAAPARATAPDGAGLARAVDAYARPLVERGHLSGQLLIARGDRVLVERNFGFASRELQVPVRAETRFCIASVTKPMTVLLALRAIDRKQIGYRDSIARWLPDFPSADRITVEHLLRHRSGIPHEILPDSESTQPRSAAEMVARAAKLPLDFPPGSQRRYSSGGFTVMARILEIATGKPYATQVDEELFRPLGMTHSLHTDGLAILPDRACAYVPGEKGIMNAPYQDFSGLVGAGSVWSTARDLHKFVRAVVTGQLGEGMLQSFVRDGKLDFNGLTGGYRAFADWDSTTGLEVIFTGNCATGAADLVRQAIPSLAAGKAMAPPPLPEVLAGGVPVEKLSHVEGDFQLENGVRLHLQVRGSGLWCNDWPLEPMAGGAFFSPRDYGVVRPVEGADGRVERLDWTQRGQVYPAPRVSGAGR